MGKHTAWVYSSGHGTVSGFQGGGNEALSRDFEDSQSFSFCRARGSGAGVGMHQGKGRGMGGGGEGNDVADLNGRWLRIAVTRHLHAMMIFIESRICETT